MGRIIPYIMENIKCLKPPTRYLILQPLSRFVLQSLRSSGRWSCCVFLQFLASWTPLLGEVGSSGSKDLESGGVACGSQQSKQKSIFMGNLWISLESCWCMMGPQRPCPSNFIQTASSISSSAMVGARTVSLEVSWNTNVSTTQLRIPLVPWSSVQRPYAWRFHECFICSARRCTCLLVYAVYRYLCAGVYMYTRVWPWTELTVCTTIKKYIHI